jgi:hypothetical protein
MKASPTLFLSLGLAAVAAAQIAAPDIAPRGPLPESAVREQVLELVKEDARKVVGETKAETAALDPSLDSHSVAEGVLQLDPVVVTEKKPITPVPRLKLTLDNFFYGDGKIFESAGKRVSLSAGPERRGLAALKLNIKF